MLIRRDIASKVSDLKKSVLLLGPRQTGKSTLMRQLCPEVEINLADEEQYIQFLSDPGLLRKRVAGKQIIFVDEVQRIPSLLNTIQAMIDQDSSVRFLLSGSSARKLKRGKANLLPGRILSYEMGPLTHIELGSRFDYLRAMSTGLLPGIYLEEDALLAQKILRTYSTTYLKEEVQAESLTRNLEGFSRFFNVIIENSGNFLDYSKFSSRAMIDRSSARRYFDILVDTLILCPIDPFAKSKKTRLIQHPRYYCFDIGALNGALNNFRVSSDRKGMLYEHLFLQLLLSSAKSNDHLLRVSVYRTESGGEVDFIVEREGEIFAVEVKATKNIGNHDLNGLRSFKKFYGKRHQPLVIYEGEEEQEFDGVPIRSLTSGLKLLGY